MKIFISLLVIVTLSCTVYLLYQHSPQDTEPGQTLHSQVPTNRNEPRNLERPIDSDPEEDASKLQASPGRRIFEEYRNGNLDLKEALAQLAVLPSDRRADAMEFFAIRVAEDDPQKAIALVVDEFGSGRSSQISAISNIFRRLVDSDFDQAAALTYELPPGAMLDKAVSVVAHNWTAQRLPDAIAWVEQLPFADMRELALGGIAQTVSEEPLETVTSLLREVTNPGMRDSLIASTAGRISKTDPKAAMQWVGEQSSDGQRFFGSILQGWATAEPQEAADYLASIEDGRLRAEYDSLVAGAYMMADVKRAAQWALGFGEQWGDYDVMGKAVDSWLHQNSLEASKWIAALPPGAGQDEAIRTMLNHLDAKRADQITMQAWMQRISNAESRQKVTEELGLEQQ